MAPALKKKQASLQKKKCIASCKDKYNKSKKVNHSSPKLGVPKAKAKAARPGKRRGASS
jgi:hypothetical protein